ncbi:MAG: sodium:proton antiporter [Thermoplasmata archaeon]|nr:sodium:proton antiporter [Thermoplasmata archaeon]
MTKIVRVFSNAVFGFSLIFGFYVVLHGHLTPGGGFQGGAIMASAVALLIIAYGPGVAGKRIKKRALSTMESIGLLGFILLAIAGIASAMSVIFGNFLLDNPLKIFSNIPPQGPNPGFLNTAGTLPWMSLFVGLEVLAGISLIVMHMAKGLPGEIEGEKGGETK